MRPNEQRERVLAALRAGESVRTVAERFGVPRSTVGLWRKLAEPDSPSASQDDRPARPFKAQGDLPEDVPDSAGAEDIAETQDQASGQLDELEEDKPPPILDRFRAEAWKRYLNLLVNDVAHSHALDAAQKIDEDFHVSDEHAQRLLQALGKGVDEPIRFASNWSAGTVAPPDYVQSVYEQFLYDEAQQQGIADYLFGIAKGAYLEGVNDQLTHLGVPVAPSVGDPDVLAALQEEASSIAEGIVETYERDLGNEVYTAWAELSAERGTQMSRYWLEQAVQDWATKRAEWKSAQVAITEQGRFFNRGVRDFMDRNRENGTIMVTKVYVTPEECECLACFQFVGDSPYDPDDPRLLDCPLHARCIHLLDAQSAPVDPSDFGDLWIAASDASSSVIDEADLEEESA